MTKRPNKAQIEILDYLAFVDGATTYEVQKAVGCRAATLDSLRRKGDVVCDVGGFGKYGMYEVWKITPKGRRKIS